MVKQIIQIGDKRLSEKSASLSKKEIGSRETKQLIQDLLDICKKEAENSAGLSAVQIGVLKKIYVVRRFDKESDTDEDPIWEVMINPEVTLLGKTKSCYWEGCMSVGIGEDRLFGPVTRQKRIRVKYLDQNGKAQKLDAEGFFAHVIQHEQDHLEGILFLKYIQNPKNIWKSKDLDKYLEENEGYPEVE